MIYLDNAATTYPKPDEVYEALDFANRNLSFNAGRGAYLKSNEALKILDGLRKEIAGICKTDYTNVVLLSSATEALNTIINGLDLKDGMNVYLTPFEHNAIIRPLYNLKQSINFNIFILPFDKQTWEPDIPKIQNMFALNNPDVVFSSQISNVTGLLIDYSNIFKISKKYNCINVLDAAQGLGIVKPLIDCVDFIVFAGHKSFYGPFGIGGFINLFDRKLKITKSGGTGSDTLNHLMPESGYQRYESGSPNVPAAYGTLIGLKWIKLNKAEEKEIDLTRHLITSLLFIKKIKVFIPKDYSKIISIVSLSVDGYSAEEVGEILSEEFDICVRTGYHCAPFVHDFINSSKNGGTVRISLSVFNTKKDIDALLNALNSL